MSAMYCALSQCEPDISRPAQWGQSTCLPHPLPHTGPCAPESQSLQRAYSLSPQSTHHGVSISHLAFCTRSVFRRETAPACARHRWREDTAGGSSTPQVRARPLLMGPCTHLGVIKRAPPCSRRLGLEGPDVARALVRVVRSLVASLVR